MKAFRLRAPEVIKDFFKKGKSPSCIYFNVRKKFVAYQLNGLDCPSSIVTSRGMRKMPNQVSKGNTVFVLWT